MVISSRTPEGSSNGCPVCGNFIRIEPSQPFGDAPCPICGHLLWFLNLRAEPRFFPADEQVRERVLNLVAQQWGVDPQSLDSSTLPAFVDDLGADSLDIVELVMELEEEFE